MKKYSSITRVNSRRTWRSNKVQRLITIALVCVVLLIVIPRAIGVVSSWLFEPLAKAERSFFSVSSLLPTFITERAQLVAENEALRNKVTLSAESTHTAALLKHENAELRNLLGRASSTRVVASVISRPTATPYDVLVLDVGSAEGIVEHAPVYLGRDQVIGFISQVYTHSSLVSLVTTPGMESTVYIFGPNIYTTAVGEGAGVLQVSVPQGILLSEGDLVVLPTLGSGVFGAISLVESHPTEPAQRGYVTFDTPLQSLRLVSVGTEALVPLSFDEAAAVIAEKRTELTKIPVPSGVLVETGTTSEATTTASTTADTSDVTETDEVE